jgi:multiple sugar transport system substrate-binding protein
MDAAAEHDNLTSIPRKKEDVMKGRIRIFCTIVALTLVTAAPCFATGAQETGKAVEKTKIVLWGAIAEEKGPAELIQNYMKANPNVTVEYVTYVNNDQGNVKLDTALLAGETIDVFTTYGTVFRERRVNAKLAADITALCKKYDVDIVRDFGQAAADNIVDGKVYSVPTTMLVNLIAVNKNMFDQAGIPIPSDWTWDQLKEIAKKLTRGEGAAKVYGILRDFNNMFPQDMIATKYDDTAELSKDLSRSTWQENPDFKRAFLLLHDMMYADKSLIAYEDMLAQKLTDSNTLATAFLSGRGAMMFTGSYMLRNLKDAEKFPRDFVIGFAPVPKVDAGQKIYYRASSHNDYMMVNARSAAAEESVKFIKWYASTGYGPMIKGGRLPLYSKYDPAKASELLTSGAEKLLDAKSFASILAPTPYQQQAKPGSGKNAAVLDKIYREEQEKYFLGHQDLDATLANLQARYDEVLAQQ